VLVEEPQAPLGDDLHPLRRRPVLLGPDHYRAYPKRSIAGAVRTVTVGAVLP